jgi:large subunit ribosomal protein L10
MTSQKKLNETKKLKELLLKYKVISVGDINSLPSKQFQNIRAKLKPNVEIRVTKKASILRTISELKEKDLKPLEKYIKNSMPVILFSNEDPFKLYKSLKKSKSKAAAKPGQKAPNDIEVKAGPTDFPPGPIIGELGQVGILAAVEGGKIAIKKDKIIVKEGEVISSKVASILTKLGIEPMEIGLNLKAVYDNGTIYEKSVLDMDEEKLLNDIKLAHSYALNLALKINYFSKETIKILINKGYLNAKALESKIDFDTTEEIKKEPKDNKEINLKKSSFEEDSEKAQEVLTQMKDSEKIKKSSSKKPEEKPSSIKAEDLINN